MSALQRYDPETGQVFKEKILPTPERPRTPWYEQCDGQNRQDVGVFFNDQNASSLMDMVVRTVIKHSRCLTAEILRHVPWTMGRRIWRETSGFISFDLWKAFVMAYPEMREFITFKYVSCHEGGTLGEYMTPLTSEAFEWVVHLSIICDHENVSRVQLVNLMNLRNIVTLGIAHSGDSRTPELVDDSLIRSWSRSATEQGAFSKLRLLSLYGWADVTSRSIPYLSAFPELTHFLVNETPRHQEDFGSNLPKEWKKYSSNGGGWLFRTDCGSLACEQWYAPSCELCDCIHNQGSESLSGEPFDLRRSKTQRSATPVVYLEFGTLFFKPRAPNDWTVIALQRQTISRCTSSNQQTARDDDDDNDNERPPPPPPLRRSSSNVAGTSKRVRVSKQQPVEDILSQFTNSSAVASSSSSSSLSTDRPEQRNA